MRKIFYLCILCLCCWLHATATNYYVSASGGNDTYPGTLDSCFLTITKGISMLAAGDTLYVKNGTYVEEAVIKKNGTSWGNPVVIMAYPGHIPVINPASVSNNGAVCFTSSGADTAKYVVFDGFVVDADSITNNGIGISDAAHHIRVKNCEIKNVGGANGHGIRVFSDCPHNEFLSNTIHDIQNHGISLASDSNLASACILYNNYAGIFSSGVFNKIFKNKAYDNTAYGIYLAGSYAHTCNNLCHNNGTHGIYLAGVNDCNVYNNTCTENTGHGIFISSGSTSNAIKNNIGWSNTSGSITDNGSSTTLTTNLTANPQFVDAATTNFNLKANSPAIDYGTTLTEITEDIEGTSRLQRKGTDIGAYETTILNHGFYVDSATGNNSNPGTLAYPYLTIMYAHSQAGTTGDSILVFPGTYSEIIELSKNNITLKAFIDTIRPLIKPDTSLRNDHAMGVYAPPSGSFVSNVTVNGFIIDGINQNYRGIDLHEAHFITIKNCEVRNTTMSGILTSSSYRNLFTNIKVHHCGKSPSDHGFT